MMVWRLCRRVHADLSGAGGRLVSGRWHTAGRPVIYTAYEPALAILEVRVHLDLPFADLPDDYVLVAIELGNLALPVAEISETMGLVNTRAIGDAWLAAMDAAVLNVPSALAPRGRNYLINPLHPDATQVSVAGIEAFTFDRRLWSFPL